MKTKLLFSAFIASAFGLFLNITPLAAPILVPTLDDNTPGARRKLRGGTIDYAVVITNTGDADAPNVTLTNPTPLNTTDIAGSVRVTPIAKPNIQPL